MPKKATDAGKLEHYQRKRDFDRTPEPAGAPPRPDMAGPRRFVVQRHRARRLHYDLRFEIDGVLASWAVPKGPTLDPDVKRIAVHVEDHPIEYLEFEGIIPRGEYGGGDVIVWDLGTWEPHATDDPAASVAAGELHADVTGHKLRGRLVLVRSGRDRDNTNQWLLLHKKEIDKLAIAVERQGMTMVPLELYFNKRGRVKLRLALATGKKLHDKRETEAKRDWQRQKARLLRDKG